MVFLLTQKRQCMKRVCIYARISTEKQSTIGNYFANNIVPDSILLSTSLRDLLPTSARLTRNNVKKINEIITLIY